MGNTFLIHKLELVMRAGVRRSNLCTKNVLKEQDYSISISQFQKSTEREREREALAFIYDLVLGVVYI